MHILIHTYLNIHRQESVFHVFINLSYHVIENDFWNKTTHLANRNFNRFQRDSAVLKQTKTNFQFSVIQ